MTVKEFWETTAKDIYIMEKYIPIKYRRYGRSKYHNRHIKQVTTVGNVDYVELYEKIEKR